MLKEIRFHGRGGQGVVTGAEVLAHAAFHDGKSCQAFPFFGSERMGSPLSAFVRIDERPIRLRTQIYEPDYVIVQDPTLIGVVDFFSGLKEGGMLILNHEKRPEDLNLKTRARIVTVPATDIALEVLGRPIPNTVMLGAFAAATGEVSLEALKEGIRARFHGTFAEKNMAAVEKAYQKTRGDKA